MKVVKDFYCMKEKITYKKGDEYKGTRKDLNGYVNYPKTRVKKSK